MSFSKVLRVGLYERVSTLEQSTKGFSIEVQKANLEDYAEKNNMKIVDHYTDEGISGTKPPLKRPGLKRLLDDVQDGKIDIIIFTKLDRWFRSVKEYYKVQDILDNNKVEWKAIHENYDTTTANGQMAITMFLAIAQNERDRTAERIKVVLDHKRKHGEVCFGGPAPFGYKKERNENGVLKLVKDPETQQAVQEFWDILVESNNLNKAIRHMHETYNFNKGWNAWSRMSKSEFYCGMHRDNMDFCPPYVSPENFLRFIETRPVKATPTGRVYIFRGLMRCPECNYKLGGCAQKQKYGTYKHYRCVNRCKTCNYKSVLSEKKLEKYMLESIGEYMRKTIEVEELQLEKPKPKRKSNVSTIRENIRKLNVMYQAGGKTDQEYLKELKELQEEMKRAETEVEESTGPNINELKNMLNSEFETAYQTFDDEEKQVFWTRLIKEIKLEGKTVVDVKFF